MNASPLTSEIEALVQELKQSLPSYVHQLDRREVNLIYERVTELMQYLQRLRTPHPVRVPVQQRPDPRYYHPHTPAVREHHHHSPADHQVVAISHDGFPGRSQGHITVHMANGQQTTVIGTENDYHALMHRFGLVGMAHQIDMVHHPIDMAHQIARRTVQQHTLPRAPRVVAPPPPQFEEVFEMTLETPSWVVMAPSLDEMDEDEVEAESFNMPQPPRQQSGLVAATRLPSTTYEQVTSTTEQPPKDDTCPICLMKFQDGHIVRELPCNHIFHDGCVLQWFVKDDRCPKCRANINGTNNTTTTRAAPNSTAFRLHSAAVASHHQPDGRRRVNP
jgi:hypothetical protein